MKTYFRNIAISLAVFVLAQYSIQYIDGHLTKKQKPAFKAVSGFLVNQNPVADFIEVKDLLNQLKQDQYLKEVYYSFVLGSENYKKLKHGRRK